MTPIIFGLLLLAAWKTVWISAVSILMGLTFGVVVAAARASDHVALRWSARAYVSFFRGVPLLVQLLLIYNLLPSIGIDVPSTVAAIAGLSLCTAAYQAENLRGGFDAVPKSLLEAADMVGLTPLQRMFRIHAPLAFRLTLPSLVNEAIMILKSSSLVSVVGVIELTRMAQDLDTSFKPLQLYTAAGALYFIINRSVAYLGSYAEARLAWGRA